MRGRINRRLIQMMVLCLPLLMAADCDSDDFDSADGVLAIIASIVQLVFTIIDVF
jgi:hypothetical protein